MEAATRRMAFTNSAISMPGNKFEVRIRISNPKLTKQNLE